MAMDLTFHTRTQQRRPCPRHAGPELGASWRPCTCDQFTPDAARKRRLERMERQAERNRGPSAGSSESPPTRTRSIATDIEVY